MTGIRICARERVVLRKRFLIMLICLVLLLSGCQVKAVRNEEKTASLFAMDTSMTIRLIGGSEELLSSLQKRVSEVENQVSVTRENSDVYTLNHDHIVSASEDTYAIISRALDLCRETDGALDISVYPVVREWGFTTGAYQVPNAAAIAELLKNVDYKAVKIDGSVISVPENMSVDLGSVTKGYTGEILAEMIRSAGVKSAILDLGGNVQTVGCRPDGTPWRVAVRSPEGDGLIGVVEISDEAVVTSGGYERYFEDDKGNIWWHIMDPSTGYPARNGVISMTIIGRDGIRCDGLSTALFVMGSQHAVEFWKNHKDFEMIMITDKGELILTPALEKRFTPDPSIPYEIIVLPES
jgi:thiamine biosynthesis lipoprotein